MGDEIELCKLRLNLNIMIYSLRYPLCELSQRTIFRIKGD